MIEITGKLVQKTCFPNLFDYGRNGCELECQQKFIRYNIHLKKTKERSMTVSLLQEMIKTDSYSNSIIGPKQ